MLLQHPTGALAGAALPGKALPRHLSIGFGLLPLCYTRMVTPGYVHWRQSAYRSGRVPEGCEAAGVLAGCVVNMANKNLIIACVSNLSTAYNLIVINLAHIIIQNQYCNGDNCHSAVTLASTSCLVGAIAGQLTFGYVGDCLGRSRALQLTMALSILGAVASAFAVPFDKAKPETVFDFIAITRFFLGLGVGGVYPLSATIAQESSGSNLSRGRTASFVFSMQGVGYVLVPLVGMAVIAIFGNPPNKDAGGVNDNGIAWRLMLGLGAVPGLLLAPFKAVETGRGSSSHPTGAAPLEQLNGSSMQSHTLTLCDAFKMRRYWGKIIGCAGGWFLFDITFYGNSLFQGEVLEEVFDLNTTIKGEPRPIQGDIHTNPAIQYLVIAAIALPGYYVAVALMDRMGRRIMQLQGFLFMAVAFGALGVWKDALESAPIWMLLIYSLTFFFSNFGPNSTTFILPAESFPSELRSTLNGFSAACGKAGATLGSSTFKMFSRSYGLGPTMLACAGVSLLGLLLTFFFVEDRRGKQMEGESSKPPPLSTLDHQRESAHDEVRGGVYP